MTGGKPRAGVAAGTATMARSRRTTTALLRSFARALLRAAAAVLALLFLAALVASVPPRGRREGGGCRCEAGGGGAAGKGPSPPPPAGPFRAVPVLADAAALLAWSVASWAQPAAVGWAGAVRQRSWELWERRPDGDGDGDRDGTPAQRGCCRLEIPEVSIPDLVRLLGADGGGTLMGDRVHDYLVERHGADWRDRPLLMRGILRDPNDDDADGKKRNLSLEGLLGNDQVVPFFENATASAYALTPTSSAPVSRIVRGMLEGRPYKIGSQLLVQENPGWLDELLGPTGGGDNNNNNNNNNDNIDNNNKGNRELLTRLFGDHFTEEGFRPGRFLPATTHVPIFVARVTDGEEEGEPRERRLHPQGSGSGGPPETAARTGVDAISTGLHCEPIGNVAFQVEGTKVWTLVPTDHSRMIRPSPSADGRAFFTSSLRGRDGEGLAALLDRRGVPHWTADTGPGDALWVPTWTWHQVDHRGPPPGGADLGRGWGQQTVSIGVSIFHLRLWDFVWRNPLYAALAVPAMRGETQCKTERSLGCSKRKAGKS